MNRLQTWIRRMLPGPRLVPLVPLVAALLASGCAAPPSTSLSADAASAVKVTFIEPQRFTDVGNSRHASDAARQADLDQLARYLRARAGRVLAPGQQLSVDVTDVDLAGQFEPWRGHASNVRIVRDLYPPRIDLRFRLSDAEGQLLREGTRQLRDSAFLLSAYRTSDPLRHEKALLDEWLRSEIETKR